MAKENSSVRGKASRILRLALLWARKGGVFRRLLIDIRLAPKLIKILGHATPHDRIYYREQELSFNKTPIIDLKMHCPPSMRFHIPCMTAPQVDFDYDFSDDGPYEYDAARRSFLKGCDEEGEQAGASDEGGIDERAKEFISKFYHQMKMQRQISYLQYNNETPSNRRE